MKLIARAKPVRIRITVGGEEHNSLESLQKNYVWDDIIPLLDGRLAKWLRRINANSIADNLSGLQSPTENPLKVYNILFRNDSQFVDKNNVFNECEQNQLLMPLAEVLARNLKEDELLEYAKSYRGIVDIFAKPLSEICQQFTGEEPGNRLFEIGEFLYNLESYKEIGKNCILLAAKRGLREANDFKRILFSKQNNGESLTSVLESSKTIDKISYSWKMNVPISLYGTLGLQKDVFNLSNVCLTIFYKSKSISNSDGLRNLVDSYFDMTSSDDPLYPEKIFVRALFDNDIKIAKQRLQKIKYYYPAEVIFKSGKFDSDGHIFQLCKGFTNSTHLRHFVTHLLNFRNHDESGK